MTSRGSRRSSQGDIALRILDLNYSRPTVTRRLQELCSSASGYHPEAKLCWIAGHLRAALKMPPDCRRAPQVDQSPLRLANLDLRRTIHDDNHFASAMFPVASPNLRAAIKFLCHRRQTQRAKGAD